MNQDEMQNTFVGWCMVAAMVVMILIIGWVAYELVS